MRLDTAWNKLAWVDSKPDDLRDHSKVVQIMMNLQQNVETSIKCLEVVDILEIAKWVVLPVGDFVDVEAKAMEVVKATVVAKAMEEVKVDSVIVVVAKEVLEVVVEVKEVVVEVKEALEVAVEASEARADLATIVDLVTAEVEEDLETVEDSMAVLEAAEAVVDMEIMGLVEATK